LSIRHNANLLTNIKQWHQVSVGRLTNPYSATWVGILI
jgi:hypothetical protein